MELSSLAIHLGTEQMRRTERTTKMKKFDVIAVEC